MNTAYIMGVLYKTNESNLPFKLRYYCFRRNLTGKKSEDLKYLFLTLGKVDKNGWRLVKPVSFNRIPWFPKDGSCLFKTTSPQIIRKSKFGEKEIIKHTKQWFPTGTIDWEKVEDWKKLHPEEVSFPDANWSKQLLQECKFEPWLLFRIAFRRNEKGLIIRFVLFKGLQNISKRIEKCVKKYKEEFYGLISFGVLWETLEDKNVLWEENFPGRICIRKRGTWDMCAERVPGGEM